MATPAIVQSISVQTASGVSSHSASFGSNITVGNTLVCLHRDVSTDLRVHTTEDNLNGSPNVWTLEAQSSGGKCGYAAYYLNSAAGACQITTGVTSSVSSWYWMAFEVSDADAADAGDANGFNTESDATNQSSHEAFIPDDTFSADSIVLTAAQHNSTSGTLTAGDGQTIEQQGGNGGFFSKIYSSGATEGGNWTSGVARRKECASVSLKSSGGGGGVTVPIMHNHYRNLRAA